MPILNPKSLTANHIRYLSQATEPVLTINSQVVLWNDTTLGRKWLLARVGGLTLRTELT
jgi:hypothetical protein